MLMSLYWVYISDYKVSSTLSTALFATSHKPYTVHNCVEAWQNTLAYSQKSHSECYALIKLFVRHHNEMDISLID